MENRYTDLKIVEEKIAAGKHKHFVGGMWDRIGSLQFEYLKSKGLKPHDKLLDVGCGSLRGGVHFIPYLDPLHYYGFDLNMSLIQAGLDIEVKKLGVSHKVDVRNFSASKGFKYAPDWPSMDMALAISLLTHLNYKSVCTCLKNTAQMLKKEGRFYATIFEVSEESAEGAFEQSPGIITYPIKDPYHYTRSQIYEAAITNGLTLLDIEDFGHPRNQKMAIFKRRL